MIPTEAQKKQARRMYCELWSTAKTTNEAMQDMRDIAQAIADAYESGVRDSAAEARKWHSLTQQSMGRSAEMIATAILALLGPKWRRLNC